MYLLNSSIKDTLGFMCFFRWSPEVFSKKKKPFSHASLIIKADFGRDVLKMVTRQPFVLLGIDGKYDVSVNVNGGGLSGQAGAIRLGISRGIEKVNPDYRKTLKENGYLTRDSREVERKKPGQPGARKKFQFSKR